MGLKGSKSMLSFRCFPSSVMTSLHEYKSQRMLIPAKHDKSVRGNSIVELQPLLS